jgi:polyhydroxyalkanoate synthesis regulator phasin
VSPVTEIYLAIRRLRERLQELAETATAHARDVIGAVVDLTREMETLAHLEWNMRDRCDRIESMLDRLVMVRAQEVGALSARLDHLEGVVARLSSRVGDQ